MVYSHTYCTNCGPLDKKMDKCPKCKGWTNVVYKPQEG